MARYEIVEGTTGKFWEIELAKAAYTQKWGKIGGSTKISTKTCKDAATAKKAHDKLVAEKLALGYALASAKTKPAAKAETKPASNAELERAIIANPDDADAYLVYADWLQAAGDIRGELAVLQHARKTRQANNLLAKQAEGMFGPFAKRVPKTFELEWFCGFIKSATIGWNAFSRSGEYGDDDDDDLSEAERCEKDLTAFLKHPSMRFVQELHLGPIPGDEEMSNRGCAHAIDQARPACLHTLYLDRIDRWDLSSTSVSLPESKSIPNVRVVKLRGGSVHLPKIDLPQLREFTVESGGMGAPALKTIGKAKWPQIERLVIWCGDPNYGASGSAKDLAPIFTGAGLAKLRHLGIQNCAFADEVAAALVKAKVVAQLETLDLSMGNLSDRGVDTLVAAKAHFAHLKLLNLDDNALTEISKPKIKGLAKAVTFGTQDSPERAVPRSAEVGRWRRYVAVGE